MTVSTNTLQIAFVCVQNAGRSQMAYAFASRELAARELANDVSVRTGGTRPAAHVHAGVVEAMADVGIDIADRTPREITVEETTDSDIVITMGCSAEDVCPATWSGDSRDWDLDDPDGKPPEEVAAIRDDIERRVVALFDEVEAETLDGSV